MSKEPKLHPEGLSFWTAFQVLGYHVVLQLSVGPCIRVQLVVLWAYGILVWNLPRTWLSSFHLLRIKFGTEDLGYCSRFQPALDLSLLGFSTGLLFRWSQHGEFDLSSLLLFGGCQ